MASLAAIILAPCLAFAASADTKPTDVVETKPDTHLLVYKFKQGQPVHYEVSQRTARDSRVASQVQVIRERITEKKHLSVIETRDDGSFVLKIEFDHVVMEADLSGKKVLFDSSKPSKEDPPGFGHVRKSLEKAQYHVHFAPNGKLLGIKRLSNAKSGDGKKAGKNDDGSSQLVVFPEEPIKVGSSWKEEYVVKLPMTQDIVRSITILRTYRLSSVRNGIARINFATSLKTPVRSPEILARLIQATPSGTVEFDIDSGQIVRRSLRVDETVLNHSGAQSMLKTVSKRFEKLVRQPAAAADQKTASTEE
jgi:hypothetical protein